MRIIGLTGGIGSGKSTVSAYIRQKGYRVLDADKVAAELTEVGSPVLESLADAFGRDILLADGRLDRKKLGEIVFSDRKAKETIDKITHGAVIRNLRQQIEESRNDGLNAVFVDVPLLFESGFDRFTDEVWTVTASGETKIRRIMERDGLTETDILKRMDMQMSDAEKVDRSKHVLDNDREREQLYAQIDNLLEKIKD